MLSLFAVLVGKPMYFMEAALGQYGQVGVCPLLFFYFIS
jgi:hypothetical protein